MLHTKLFAVVAVGLSATACSYDSTTTAAIPAAPGPVVVGSPSARACVEYGFVPGTIAYNRCIEREHAARLRGRYGLKLPDAIQLASALAINADALVTHDRDFDSVTGIPVLG